MRLKTIDYDFNHPTINPEDYNDPEDLLIALVNSFPFRDELEKNPLFLKNVGPIVNGLSQACKELIPILHAAKTNKSLNHKQLISLLKKVEDELTQVKKEIQSFMLSNFNDYCPPDLATMINSLSDEKITSFEEKEETLPGFWGGTKIVGKTTTLDSIREMIQKNFITQIYDSAMFTKHGTLLHENQYQMVAANQTKQNNAFMQAFTLEFEKTPAYTQMLKDNIMKELIVFSTIVNHHTSNKLKYTEQERQKKIEAYIDDNTNLFEQLSHFSQQISYAETTITTNNTLLKLTANTDKQKELQNENLVIESSLAKLKSQLAEIKKQQIRGFNSLVQDLVEFPNDDIYDEATKNLAALNVPNLKQSTKEAIAKSYYEILIRGAAAWCPNVATFTRVSKGLALGAGVGLMGGFFAPISTPIGAVVGGAIGLMTPSIANSLDKAKDQMKATLYGEFSVKYAKEEFTPSEDMIKLFGQAKAETVNAFYINILFELDLINSNLSQAEKNSEDGKFINNWYEHLYKRYQSIRKQTNLTPEQCHLEHYKDIQQVLNWYKERNNSYFSSQFIKIMEYIQKVKDYYLSTEPSERALTEPLLALPMVYTSEVSISNVGPAVEQQTGRLQQLPLELQNSPTQLVNANSQSLVGVEAQSALARIITSKTQVTNKRQGRDLVNNPRQREIQGIEDQLIRLQEDILASGSVSNGFHHKIEHLAQLSATYANGVNLEDLRQQQNPLFHNLAAKPIERDLNEVMLDFASFGHTDLLLWWFKEACFMPTVVDKRSKACQILTLEGHEGKTLWHLLCERPNGATTLEKIFKFQNLVHTFKPKFALPSFSKMNETLDRTLELGDYFDPTITYNGQTVFEYATRLRNSPFLRELCENMQKSTQTLSQDDVKTAFNFLERDKNANLISHALKGTIEQNTVVSKYNFIGRYSKKAVTSVAQNVFGITAGLDETYAQLMTAMSIYVARNQQPPNNENELFDFVKSMTSKGSTFYVEALAKLNFNDQQLQKISQEVFKHISSTNLLRDFQLKENVSDEQRQLAWTMEQCHLPNPQQSLIIAILNGDINFIEQKLKLNPQIAKTKFKNGYNLLYLSCLIGADKIAATLYAHGADVDTAGNILAMSQKPLSDSGFVAAARNAHVEVIKSILAIRAQSNFRSALQRRQQDFIGRTALHYFADVGNFEGITAILETITKEHGAFMTVLDTQGSSPFTLLVAHGHLEVIKKIDTFAKDKGYKRGVVDYCEKSFIESTNGLEIAIGTKQPEMIVYLLNIMMENKLLSSKVVSDALSVYKESPYSINLKSLTDRITIHSQKYTPESLINYAILAAYFQDYDSFDSVVNLLLVQHKESAPSLLTFKSNPVGIQLLSFAKAIITYSNKNPDKVRMSLRNVYELMPVYELVDLLGKTGDIKNTSELFLKQDLAEWLFHKKFIQPDQKDQFINFKLPPAADVSKVQDTVIAEFTEIPGNKIESSTLKAKMPLHHYQAHKAKPEDIIGALPPTSPSDVPAPKNKP